MQPFGRPLPRHSVVEAPPEPPCSRCDDATLAGMELVHVDVSRHDVRPRRTGISRPPDPTHVDTDEPRPRPGDRDRPEIRLPTCRVPPPAPSGQHAEGLDRRELGSRKAQLGQLRVLETDEQTAFDDREALALFRSDRRDGRQLVLLHPRDPVPVEKRVGPLRSTAWCHRDRGDRDVLCDGQLPIQVLHVVSRPEQQHCTVLHPMTPSGTRTTQLRLGRTPVLQRRQALGPFSAPESAKGRQWIANRPCDSLRPGHPTTLGISRCCANE